MLAAALLSKFGKESTCRVRLLSSCRAQHGERSVANINHQTHQRRHTTNSLCTRSFFCDDRRLIRRRLRLIMLCSGIAASSHCSRTYRHRTLTCKFRLPLVLPAGPSSVSAKGSTPTFAFRSEASIISLCNAFSHEHKKRERCAVDCTQSRSTGVA